jgi:hypothetical protein
VALALLSHVAADVNHTAGITQKTLEGGPVDEPTTTQEALDRTNHAVRLARMIRRSLPSIDVRSSCQHATLPVRHPRPAPVADGRTKYLYLSFPATSSFEDE